MKHNTVTTVRTLLRRQTSLSTITTTPLHCVRPFLQQCSTYMNSNSKTSYSTSKLVAQKPIAQPERKIRDTELYRYNIGIFGAMNSGKSTVMNSLTQSETSIVDSTPGTTADVKVALMELHSVGPCKVFDTPGINETGVLGMKKKQKAITALKEVDLAVIVVNPLQQSSLDAELELVELAHQFHKKFIILYNIFSDKKDEFLKERNFTDLNEHLDSFERHITKHYQQVSQSKEEINLTSSIMDMHSTDSHQKLVRFIEHNAKLHPLKEYPVLPPIKQDSIVVLNIPMDAETPNGRLLRPQAIVQEHLIRNYVNTFAYRMNLAKARSKDPIEVEEERQRFVQHLNTLKQSGKLKLVITDSQAIDVVQKWTKDEKTGNPLCDITTFSVVMIDYMSTGRLQEFVDAIEAFKNLKKGDKVLICEACNHNRILDDIGTVQIPNKIRKHFGENFVELDWAFGRDYQSKNLNEYKLVLHCGGCMLDKQKIDARLHDLKASGVPVTNYGVLLSWFQSEETLKRVTSPLLHNQKLME